MIRPALATASLLNALAGLTLVGAFFLVPAMGLPVVALGAGAALFAQGAFTLLSLASLPQRWGTAVTNALVAGQTASILAGGLATCSGILYNLHPRNDDFEFGPMSLGMLMVAQAILALLHTSQQGGRRSA